MKGFWAESMYGLNSRQPLVKLRYQDFELQCSPEEARAIAVSILEAAEASEADAFLVEWAMSACNTSTNEATALLREFRTWREARRAAESHAPKKEGP